jgi:hypothetical protein
MTADLKAFADAILNVAWDAGQLDGSDILDMAEQHGLVVATNVEQSCGEGCRCAEYDGFPVTCYRKTYLKSTQ